ncbi:serine-rich protein [Penicillium paradoxum]|uniref:serine-rich protein n=1 Tax=Penicillium paradoxum TaxID=176176 RepID=UPI002549206B|nr:serine-rich protein [Penicillium paradoxum]KAJ5787647.1 serine-rich protein [Penicillium paradoxum]
MVFLRLSIKVFPREQLAPSSSSSWGRSLLGGRKSVTDESSQGSAASTAVKKPGLFLLVLEQPQDVSLGGLAGMIQEHWGKLHPELEPLSIKKIVDDTKEDIDLHPDLTVADVWVDYGKARTDGLDQRGSVRVLQKPTAAVPERFPSVEPDWDAAIAAYEHKRAAKTKKEAMEREFPAIQEEDEESENGWQRNRSRSLTRSQSQLEQSPASAEITTNKPPPSTQKSPVEHRHRDLPLSSVEVRSPVTTPPPAQSGPTIAGTPPLRHESEELGESPSPAERRPSVARSRSTPASETAISELQTKPQKLVKIPIPRAISTQQTQTTEEATSSSSSESESESAHQQIATETIKARITNGAATKSVSRSPQKKQVEAQIITSSDESSDEESDDQSERDEPEKKNIEQDNRDEETGSDGSESEASEEGGPKDQISTPQIGQSIPKFSNIVDIIDLDADGDVQMEARDLSQSQTNGAFPQTRSRKRKQSSVEPIPVKEPRQGQSHPSTRQQTKSNSPRSVPEVVVSSQQSRQSEFKSPLAAPEATLPLAPVSPKRRLERAPSFSSPGRRASIREEQASPKSPQSGIGLGFTRSPPSNQHVALDFSQDSPRTADLPSTQRSFGGPLFPSSNGTVIPSSSFTSMNKETPAIERTKKSAIRAKDSPASERRSVSFADEGSESVARSTPRNAAISSKSTRATPSSATPRNAATKPKPAQQTPTPAVRPTRGTPSISTPGTATKKTPKSTSEPARGTQSHVEPVYPPGFDVAKLRQEIEDEKEAKRIAKEAEKEQKGKEAAEKAGIERKLQESTDPKHTILLTEMLTILGKIANPKADMARRNNLRSQLAQLRIQEKDCAQKLAAQKSNPRESVARQPRPTLKDMLSSQKQEMAAKTAKPRVEAKPAPAPRGDVYEVPSSSESDSSDSDSSDNDSDSDSGDIMPNGQSVKLRKPWSQRST